MSLPPRHHSRNPARVAEIGNRVQIMPNVLNDTDDLNPGILLSGRKIENVYCVSTRPIRFR